MTMTQQSTVTRFSLSQIAGNQIVDWAVVEGNFENLGNNAAHLTLGNSFGGAQSFLGNVGMTALGAGAVQTHRRFTIPAPPANETDRLHFQAESATLNGTFVGLAGPAAAGAGQRKSTLVVHGVEPTGTATPAGLTLLLDEDLHRASIQAAGNFQDLTAPILQLGAGGTDRITLPGTGPINVTGTMTLTGDINAANANFTGTLGVNGAAALRSTATITGLATFQGGMQVTGSATFTGNLTAANISGANTTFTGNLTVTGTTNLQTGLTVTGGTTSLSTLTVTGASNFSGALQFAAGAAYIQSYGADTSYVQISKLYVTPGLATFAGGLNIVGTATISGSATFTGMLNANGGITGPYSINAFNLRDPGGTPRSVMWMDGGSNTVIQAGPGESVRWVNSANSVQRMSLDSGGNLSVQGTIYAGSTITAGGSVSASSQVYTTPGGSLYLRGADGGVHIDTGNASLWLGGSLYAAGRAYFGNWDPGWTLNVGGTFITSQRAAIGGWDGGQMCNINGNCFVNGYVYDRGSTAYRCWDNGDFNYSPGVYGSYVVQRDGNGYINANYINTTADVQGGRPAYVAGQNGDNFLRWWPASAVGPPASVDLQGGGVGGGINGGGGRQAIANVTADRTGQWFCCMWVEINTQNENYAYQVYLEISVGGSTYVHQQCQQNAHETKTGGGAVCQMGVNAGNAVSFYCWKDGYSASIRGGQVYICFVPTSAQPG